MRPIGFSTGALAKGDFRRGLQLQAGFSGINAIELSALRDRELHPLVDSVATLDLSPFSYVSFHAPSRLERLSEDELIVALMKLPENWPVVVHPEVLLDPAKWQALGSRLCLENMDGRKSKGRTPAEMRELLTMFPEATFCLDLGHARQIDPTMGVALSMLSEFSHRLVELHVSEVGPAGEHLPVRTLAGDAFRRLAHRIPLNCAVIIESVVSPDSMQRELDTVRALFSVPATQYATA